jgi:hypothetical protein
MKDSTLIVLLRHITAISASAASHFKALLLSEVKVKHILQRNLQDTCTSTSSH